jgi:hypothetical protein
MLMVFTVMLTGIVLGRIIVAKQLPMEVKYRGVNGAQPFAGGRCG